MEFEFRDAPDGAEVRSIGERDGGPALWNLLNSGPIAYGELCQSMTAPQLMLFKRLQRAGMLVFTDPSARELQPFLTATGTN